MSNERVEREDHAFDALIVSHRLRDRDFNDLNDLPELTESQRALMETVPTDIVERMWNQESEIDDPSDSELTSDNTINCDEFEIVGMNRAEDMDDETKKKLEEARKIIIESMKAKRKNP
jgi:hypothetical protein